MKSMGTALLERIASLKERVERLEKIWGIKKAEAGIGEPHEGQREYADNDPQDVADMLATAGPKVDASFKRG